MSAWNPEMAPQAMVMKAKGKSVPEKTGPPPPVANSVTAGMSSGGRSTTIATPSPSTVVIFRKVDR